MVLSRAHRRSAHAIIDPTYDPHQDSPARPQGRTWWYGRGELEAYRLSLLRLTTCTASRVFHPGLFHRHVHLSRFRISWAVTHALRLSVRCCGGCTVDGQWHPAPAAALQRFALRLPAGARTIQFDVAGISEPQAMAIDGLPTDAIWEWSADGFHWAPAVPASASGSAPAHRDGPPRVRLSPLTRGELDDFGRTILGTVLITASGRGRPVLRVGESPAEARSQVSASHEQRCDLVALGGHRWRSAVDLALRHAACDGGRIQAVEAAFHPVRWRGAFACSEPALDHIWMRSAYTLRLCLHEFMLDGVKRDRLPWVGDAALALLGNAYVFGEGAILARTLEVLGGERLDECLPNAIIDYATWWLIALDLQARYWGDDRTCAREWPRAQRLLAALQARVDARGLLIHRRDDWLFIDWVPYEKQGANAALQMLWAWALRAGAAIARRAADLRSATQLERQARRLRRRLHGAFDHRRGGWSESLDVPASPLSRHAAALAVPAGVSRGLAAPLRRLLGAGEGGAPPIGTPYMAAWAAAARAELGDAPGMLADLRRIWGGMLTQDATTFWEAWDPAVTGDAALAYYGRPFGKSLCHAWAGGPAALLPMHLLGIRPLRDGWSEVVIRPRLGGLAWASACVPTPLGPITVDVDGPAVTVQLPHGITAQAGGRRRRGRFCFHAPG